MDSKATLKEGACKEVMHEGIRRTTRIGRPLGSDGFLNKLEYVLRRRVRPLPVGRQKGCRKSRDPTDQSGHAQNRR